MSNHIVHLKIIYYTPTIHKLKKECMEEKIRKIKYKWHLIKFYIKTNGSWALVEGGFGQEIMDLKKTG